MRHFSSRSNVNHVFEDVGDPMGQSREKVISGLLSLVVAEWAAVTSPKFRPNWLLDGN